MQKYATETGELLIGRAALMDTMTDLIVDSIGALAISIIGYFSIRRDNSWLARFRLKVCAPSEKQRKAMQAADNSAAEIQAEPVPQADADKVVPSQETDQDPLEDSQRDSGYQLSLFSYYPDRHGPKTDFFRGITSGSAVPAVPQSAHRCRDCSRCRAVGAAWAASEAAVKAVEAAGQGFRTDSSRSSHSIRRDTDIYTWDLRYVGRQADQFNSLRVVAILMSVIQSATMS